MKPGVFEALSKEDKARGDFWKALLLKLGLRVAEEEQAVLALSGIHISSATPSAVSKALSSWRANAVTTDNETYVKGEADTFHVQKEASAWSMGALTKAALEVLEGATNDSETAANEEEPIQDYGEAIKELVPHESAFPSSKDTPYFNHASFFEHLKAYKSSTPDSQHHQAMGELLMYAEVVTSTSTLLVK